MSDRRSGARRLAEWVMIVGMLGLIAFQLIDAAVGPTQAEVSAAARNAADELRHTSMGDLFDAEDALADSLPSGMRVRWAGVNSRGSLYQISGADGAHPVCVVVSDYSSFDSAEKPATTVVKGPC